MRRLALPLLLGAGLAVPGAVDGAGSPYATCTVPAVKAFTLPQATRRIKQATCVRGRVAKPDRIRRLVVGTQRPKPGRVVPAGTAVNLRLRYPTDDEWAVVFAIRSCTSLIDAQPTLERDFKRELKAICESAAGGTTKDVHAANIAVCNKIVRALVRKGPARRQALAACRHAG